MFQKQFFCLLLVIELIVFVSYLEILRFLSDRNLYLNLRNSNVLALSANFINV